MWASSNWRSVRTSTTSARERRSSTCRGASGSDLDSVGEERAAVQLDDRLEVGRLRAERRERALDEPLLVGLARAARCAPARTRSSTRPSGPSRGLRRAIRRGAPARPRSSAGSVSSRSCRLRKIPRAPSSRSIARSGRAMSPTNRLSPVSTAHGSSPRAVSISANAVCSGRCPGEWMRRDPERAELELPAVVERLVLVGGASLAVDVDHGAGGRGEAPVTRHVVGVVVRLEHVVDVHAHVARELEVVVDLEPRVDDRGHPGVVVPDEVGGAAEIVVGDLPEDHPTKTTTGSGPPRGLAQRVSSSRDSSRSRSRWTARITSSLIVPSLRSSSSAARCAARTSSRKRWYASERSS